MAAALIFGMQPGVVLDESPVAAYLILAERKVPLSKLSRGLLQALRLICQSGAGRDELRETVVELDGDAALPKLDSLLGQLTRARLLRRSVVTATGQHLATAIPVGNHIGNHDETAAREVRYDQRYTLSRFTFLRRDQADWVLESAVAPSRIVLHDGRCAAMLSALASGRTPAELAGSEDGVPASCFLELLFTSGMLTEVSEEGDTAEDSNAILEQWEFHDLLMHSRCRLGRHSHPVGGTYRFAAASAPLPAIKPKMSEDATALYRPDMDYLKAHDTPFTGVLESRHSIRVHGNPPLSDRQLGEFLYRVARVDAVQRTSYEEVCRRPYPAGGSLHELELYPLIKQCQGMAPGLYHYAAADHLLCRISAPNKLTDRLLADAARSTGREWEPQLLIIIAARFQRVAWKYESIAYALTLKNVGVLVQTMYLVAAAMGLAPCALGVGNADLFAQAAGTDYYAESSVGEFLLGSSASRRLFGARVLPSPVG